MLENVRVLAIDQSVNKKVGKSNDNNGDGKEETSAIVGATATLEVTPEQAKLLAWAGDKELGVVRSEIESSDDDNDSREPTPSLTRAKSCDGEPAYSCKTKGSADLPERPWSTDGPCQRN
jgi:Flp pilus assembly protein CpaB